MSDSNKESLIDKFKNAPSSTRTGLIGGAVVFFVIVVGVMMTDTTGGNPNKPKEVDKQNLINASNRQTTNESLAGEIAQTKKEVADQKAQMQILLEQARLRSDGGMNEGSLVGVDALTTQVTMLQERLAAIEGNKVAPVANLPPPSQTALSEPGVGKDGELLLGSDGMPLRAPEAGKGNQAGTLNQGQSSTPIPTTIQVVREEKKPVSQTEKKLVPTPVGYITSGANFEAVLLNGMDASTAIGANKTPTPALLRIKSDAILPNMFTFDVKECFVMVGGFGNMSTERVEMRTETMSCIDQKGQVWEGKVEGYLVGEDGKAGARGRVVSKQGALLAKSFMAGFIGGLGTAFSPQQNQALTLLQNGETQQSYQYPSGSEVLGSGISKGLSQSGNALSAFYIKLAEQMFPVVELDAGRKMTIILLKGVELKMDKRV